MAGRNRVIDPKTKDYVVDGKGGYKYTRDLSTCVYYQMQSDKEKWVGDPDAGNLLWQLRRHGVNDNTIAKTTLAVSSALQRFVDKGLATDLLVEAQKDPVKGRVDWIASLRDIQFGELDLTPLLPFGG